MSTACRRQHGSQPWRLSPCCGLADSRAKSKEFPVSYPWLLTVVGFGGGIAGARDLLTDVESGYLEGLTIVFALALYAGAALMALGAYRFSRTE